MPAKQRRIRICMGDEQRAGSLLEQNAGQEARAVVGQAKALLDSNGRVRGRGWLIHFTKTSKQMPT